MQRSALALHIQQSLPTGLLLLVWDLAGGIVHDYTVGSPLLSVSAVACLTPSASVLGKSVAKSVGLPPQYVEEAET